MILKLKPTKCSSLSIISGSAKPIPFTISDLPTANQQIFGFVKFRPTTTKARFGRDKFLVHGSAHKSTSTVRAMTTKFQPQ